MKLSVQGSLKFGQTSGFSNMEFSISLKTAKQFMARNTGILLD
jgi:hypothetical protein